MKIALSIAEYTISDDKPIVHLFGRDEQLRDWHVCVYNLRPFFYVLKSTPVPKNRRIVKIVDMTPLGWKSIKEEQLKKIVMRTPSDIGGNRKDKEGFRVRFSKTFEDDIEFTTRSLLELGIKSGFEIEGEEEDVFYGKDKIEPCDFRVELKRLHIDIEVSTVETGGRFPSYRNPVNRIYSLSCLDSYSKKLYCFVFRKDLKNRAKYTKYYTNPIPAAIEKSIKSTIVELDVLKKEYEDIIDIDLIIPDNITYENLTEEEKRYTNYTTQHYTLTEKLKEYISTAEFVKNELKPHYRLSLWTFNNEIDMLNTFIDFWKDMNADIPTGWNFKQFDAPYIIERMKKLRLDASELSPLRSVWIDKSGFARIKGKIVFDTWRGFVKTLTHERESNKLDNVSLDLFGIGKVKHNGIDAMYKHDINKLILYNVQDVFLEYAIGVKEGVFKFFYDVKCFSGCNFEDVLKNSRIVDSYMLFKAKEQQIVLPSKRRAENKDKKSKGALVIQAPQKGIQHWITVLDLKSLYPNAMLTLNMGEDTIVYSPEPERIPELIKSPIKDVYFRKDKTSFLAEIIIDLIEYRDSLKTLVKTQKNAGKISESKLTDRIQVVVKFITNSIFGVLGLEVFRLYNRKIFANITATGRIVIQYSIDLLIKLMYIVYYGDTDSVFPLLKSNNTQECLKEAKYLANYLNSKYDIFNEIFNIDKHYFLMKAEKIYKTLFMVRKKDSNRAAKKRYAGHVVWEDYEKDKLDIKGFDRSDMSRVGNTLMKKLLRMACYGKPKADMIKHVKKELFKIRNGKYELEELAFSKGISKPLQTYGNQDWIRAARWTNEFSGYWGAQTNYGGGSKPKFMYIKYSKVPHPFSRIEIIALDDNYYIPPHLVEIIDYNTLIEKTIKMKIETILEAIDITWDEIVSKFKVKRLTSYTTKGK